MSARKPVEPDQGSRQSSVQSVDPQLGDAQPARTEHRVYAVPVSSVVFFRGGPDPLSPI